MACMAPASFSMFSIWSSGKASDQCLPSFIKSSAVMPASAAFLITTGISSGGVSKRAHLRRSCSSGSITSSISGSSPISSGLEGSSGICCSKDDLNIGGPAAGASGVGCTPPVGSASGVDGPVDAGASGVEPPTRSLSLASSPAPGGVIAIIQAAPVSQEHSMPQNLPA